MPNPTVPVQLESPGLAITSRPNSLCAAATFGPVQQTERGEAWFQRPDRKCVSTLSASWTRAVRFVTKATRFGRFLAMRPEAMIRSETLSITFIPMTALMFKPSLGVCSPAPARC